MPRHLRSLSGLLCPVAALALLGGAPLGGADKAGAEEWKYDVVHRKKSLPLRGLVLEQTSTYVRMKAVSRKPGSPTVVFTENVPRKDVARLELLKDEDRKVLKDRLEALKREREVLAAHLRSLGPTGKRPSKSADALDLRPVPWPPDPKVKGLAYQSAYFKLVSNARPEVVQLAAIHLEQVYAAYARHLPPRVKGEPTTVLLTKSLADYQAVARDRRLRLINLAFYDPGKNQVVCGSELERLADELERLRKHHAALAAQLKARRSDLLKVYRGKIPPEVLAPLAAAEKQIPITERNNQAAFAKARGRLFQRLYHEAFHAYLWSFVYPSSAGTLPHWFNEGLAQVYDTAIVEVGELRVRHADEERLKAVRTAIREGELLSLRALLRSGPKEFLAKHASDRHVSDRHYLAAWALAFYLTFDRQLLGTPALDEYVKTLKTGRDPVLAFYDLVGETPEKFEKKYQEYLKSLKPDGTTGK